MSVPQHDLLLNESADEEAEREELHLALSQHVDNYNPADLQAGEIPSVMHHRLPRLNHDNLISSSSLTVVAADSAGGDHPMPVKRSRTPPIQPPRSPSQVTVTALSCVLTSKNATVEITGDIANGQKSREAEKEIGDNVQDAIGAEEKENDEAEGNTTGLSVKKKVIGPTVAELTPKSSRIKGTEDVIDALTNGDTVEDVV